MNYDECFDDLLLSLIETLVEVPRWESFLKHLEIYLEAQNSALFLRAPTEEDDGMLVSQGLSTASPIEVVESFYSSPFLAMPDGKVRTLSDVAGSDELRARYGRYLAYHQRKGTTDIIAVNLVDESTGIWCYFRAIRYTGGILFGEHEKAAFARIVPYLRAAVKLYGLLIRQQRQIDLTEQAISPLDIGFVILQRDAKVLMMNSVAEVMIRNRNDFLVRQGRFVCTDQTTDRRLNQELRRLLAGQAHDEAQSEEVLALDSESGDWRLSLRRIDISPDLHEDGTGFASLMIHSSRRPDVLSATMLAKVLELTPAEAQLVERLVQGDSLVEAAERLGRSPLTARAQLGSVFSKTGVRKQHQLISHVMHAAIRQWPS